jgi:3-phenylpropionate/cinnamic acid dioxygenase small subunit
VIDAETSAGIAQLVSLYGHLVDARDWDGLLKLFTVDATADYTAVGAATVFKGRDEIRAYMEGATHPEAHHTSNVYVYERDGEVHVRSKWFVPMGLSADAPVVWAGGDYEDVVVRDADGWQFAHRAAFPRWPAALLRAGDTPPQ